MRKDFLHYLSLVHGWLDWAPAPLASLLVMLLAGLGALLASNLIVDLFLRIPNPRQAFFRSFLKEIRRPARLFVVVVAMGAALPAAGLSYRALANVGQGLLVAFILLLGWVASALIRVSAELYLARFKTGEEDNLNARKHVTQVRILKRAADLLLVVITVSAALMTFEPVRQYGLSLFASAGAASLVVGLAARPLLTNLIAGVQIAMTQPIRIDDAVIVEGEWGWIEEITSTYVVVRLWDWRRMILPIAYFLEKPFQNWTHQSASLIGSVYFYLDYAVPVEPMRAVLEEIVRQTPLWDGKVVNLQVSDVKDHTIEIRMLMSARNAPQTWDLRCFVRERILTWLQQNAPEALPRARVRFDPPERSGGPEPVQASAGDRSG
ncbi:mechanosensitive ion channel family protein [Acetobacteraceae bacterium KSS8]|uniref:Mechanosensitive ion channel family protein n=1 Tax=Endosaccharibacter trunci TaxID=2812733 RepID=A0ABT1W532_9PROT|nr:mechanosensitive ion channel family protein [Acetobacteraceae bacterium KSS8]